MKRTKLFVMTTAIILGLATAVHAQLPTNLLIVGKDAYDVGYLTQNGNISKVNDALINNLGALYYVDDTGRAKDIFTGAPVDDSQIVANVGNALNYYKSDGTRQKLIADSSGQFSPNGNGENTGIYAIVNVNYKKLGTTGMTVFNFKVNQLSGVNNAAYFKAGSSSITPLTDLATYISPPTSGGEQFSVYASDGITELANGNIFIKNLSNVSGEENLSISLRPTKDNNPEGDDTKGNTAVNIANNGFVTVDKDNKWIYYTNSSDSNKLYRKSVTGVDNFLISDDDVKYINVVGDWVYYSNYKDGGKIYKVRTDGTQRQKLCDDMASYLNVVGDKIYYINNSDRARIYVLDSKGKKLVQGDSAKFLSVTGNFLFYVNTSDYNKLYNYDLINNRKAKISDVNTQFVNGVSDYLIFYTGLDGVLYRSTNALNPTPTPVPIITNIPQKGGKGSTEMKGLVDKATIICSIDDDNIYYRSNVDGGKIYKLDNTGNGYKVVDEPAEFINIIGDYIYYMKSGKISMIPKDSDGTVKGTPITKPKLDQKVLKVDALPTFTTDDITKFNFPERVSAIMSDGTIRQLVVAWNRTIPKPQKGVYNFTGSILGYGNKVTMSVALDSGTVKVDKVKVKNEIGNKDSISIPGLEIGDVISVYDTPNATKPIKTAAADKNGNVNITGLNLNSDGGSIYITITKKDRAEGAKTLISYPAEAPTGFIIDATGGKISKLKPKKVYKVYFTQPNADGTVPELAANALPDTVATADDNGNIDVEMANRIKSSKNKKLAIRLKASGVTEASDSIPSSIQEIWQGKVPEYTGIDLSLGRITGTTTDMVFSYDYDESKKQGNWDNICSSGTTPISMTRSLQVAVKVKANGPQIESEPKTFGLFPMPVVTGIENGKTYALYGKDNVDKIKNLPKPIWDKNTDIIKYTASLYKADGSLIKENLTVDNITNEFAEYILSNGDGAYKLVVVGTKKVPGMKPETATNTKTVNFIISSAIPSPVDINMIEKAGTLKENQTDPDTYWQATPMWTDLAGTYPEATIKMTKTASEKSGKVEYTDVSNPAEVAFVKGSTITQSGEYEIKVKTTSKENGAVNTATKTFRVDTIGKAVLPEVQGINEGGIYKNVSKITLIDKANCVTTATIMRDGYVTEYITPANGYIGNGTTTQDGKELTVNGHYVLILNTINATNGHSIPKKISFTIDDASSNTTPDAPNGITFSFADNKFLGATDGDYSMEYSLDKGATWKQLVPSQALEKDEVYNITQDNGIWVRKKKTDTTLESAPLKIPVTATATPTLIFNFATKTISDVGNSANYQYSINGGTQWKEFTNAGQLQNGDYELLSPENKLRIRQKPSGDNCMSQAQVIDVIRLNKPTVAPTVIHVDGDPTGLQYTILNVSDDMEYSIDGGVNWTAANGTVGGENIQIPETGAKILTRYKATDGAMGSLPSPAKEYSAQAEATIPTIDKTSPSKVKFTGNTVNTLMEYSFNGIQWNDVTPGLDLECSGTTLFVRNKATNDTIVSKPSVDLLK